ncbi:D-sedoheptulose 7-phosphate isomerase [Mucilaginibacter sp.]
MLSEIKLQIQSSIQVKQALLENEQILQQIADAASLIIETYKQGGKTLLAGNGGSAADAQHIAAEFVGRYYFDRPSIPSIALSTDTSIITAIGNDYGYEALFARQVQGYGVAGDVFIGISTSGNSANIVKALQVCREKGLKSIALTGRGGGKMMDMADICIQIPSADTPRIQESHILIGHMICFLVEQALFEKA